MATITILTDTNLLKKRGYGPGRTPSTPGRGLGGRRPLARAAGGQGQAQGLVAFGLRFRGQGAMHDNIYGLIFGWMSPSRVV